MADVHGVLEIKLFDNRVGVHVMTCGSLGRATMATTIMSDYPIAFAQKEHHLGVPVVGGQRPSMMKKDRLSGPPVLIENLSAILRGDSTHRLFPFVEIY